MVGVGLALSGLLRLARLPCDVDVEERAPLQLGEHLSLRPCAQPGHHLRHVPVEIVDTKARPARRERARGLRLGRTRAPGRLRRASGAEPGLAVRTERVRLVGVARGQIERIAVRIHPIRPSLGIARARHRPLGLRAEPLSFRAAEPIGLRGRPPDERQLARLVGKLEDVDAGLRSRRVSPLVDRHHVRLPVALRALLRRLQRDAAQTFEACLARDRVTRELAVPLVEATRFDRDREESRRREIPPVWPRACDEGS